MKKIMVVVSVVAMAFAANADCFWSWWTGDKLADQKLNGCQLGIATECKQMKGAQVAIVMNKADEVAGCQLSFGYAKAETVRNGVQSAFVTVSDSAALQLGLICFNKNGFLPVFPFVNVCPKMFGSKK